jgi:hypothetical protein
MRSLSAVKLKDRERWEGKERQHGPTSSRDQDLVGQSSRFVTIVSYETLGLATGNDTNEGQYLESKTPLEVACVSAAGRCHQGSSLL